MATRLHPPQRQAPRCCARPWLRFARSGFGSGAASAPHARDSESRWPKATVRARVSESLWHEAAARAFEVTDVEVLHCTSTYAEVADEEVGLGSLRSSSAYTVSAEILKRSSTKPCLRPLTTRLVLEGDLYVTKSGRELFLKEEPADPFFSLT